MLIVRLVLILGLSMVSLGAKDSKLELGVGFATLYYPKYIGSKSYTNISLPIPFVTYKSEIFNIDEDGINRKLFNIKDLTLDLSVSGSLPADSQDIDARKDMPNLNFTFEVGPKLIYNLYDKQKLSVKFELAVRSVMETDLSMLHYQGVVTTSDIKFELDLGRLGMIYTTGARFGDERYHNYFYGVAKEYETTTRPYYNSKAGYSGYMNKLSATYRVKEWWCGALMSHHTLRGATYEDSPLLEVEDAFYLGFSFAYIFYKD